MQKSISENLEELFLRDSEECLKEFYEKYIARSCSEDIRTDFLKLFSRNYILMNLSKQDIEDIINHYKLLEFKIVQELGIDPELILELSVIRSDLYLKLNRTLIIDQSVQQTNTLSWISKLWS